MLSSMISFFLNTFSSMGYIGIIILMTIESSFIPFPSEIVVPPAAYLAFKGEMNIYLVILSSVIGSLLGAMVNYILAMTLGRTFIYSFTKTKLSKFLLINEKTIVKSEELFNKHGSMSTFFGRLIPGVRQLISIPAGLAKMNMFKFLFFTFLGSLIWTTILAVIGYQFGANETLLHSYYEEISNIGLILGIVLVLVFIIRYFIKKYKKSC